VITQPAKAFLPLVGVGVVAALVYSVLTGDHAGITMFLAVAVAALALAVSITVARQNEVAPAVAEDAPPPELRPAPAVRLPGGPGWPALAALGTGFLVVSLIGGPAFAIPGVGLAIIAAAGWLASASSDRTGHTPNLLPIGIPVVGLFAIGSLMYFMSRILLAVPEQASTFVALAVAATILAVSSFVALKPSISPRVLMVGLVIGAVLMAGGGIAANAYGQRTLEKKGVVEKTVNLIAKNVQFDLKDISLPANKAAQVDFHNDDSVPHNMSIYSNQDYTGPPVFQGAVVLGGAVSTYQLTAMTAGTYYFRCDIHPTVMKGTLTVA
jgi:plastocyanin